MPKLGSRMPNMGIRRSASPKATRRSRTGRGASLAGVLFSGTQQRVLGLLFGQPERSFFATELIGLVKGGSGAVQRELQRLTESGLVTVRRVGNQKHYQANRAAPIFEELRGIALKTLGPAEALRESLAPLADRIRVAWVYGSIAKGTDRAQSDIDVLIVADRLALEEVYKALEEAEIRLGRKVSPTLYTSKEFERRRTASNPFLAKVLAGERILLIGNEDAAAAT
ncbi:MAG: nucleotidyltransferase domain-containing protein [Burkholderiales bacterium]|nr:nucleotidyltransferase domain-containing protein [Burkholderiales bacterium]